MLTLYIIQNKISWITLFPWNMQWHAYKNEEQLPSLPNYGILSQCTSIFQGPNSKHITLLLKKYSREIARPGIHQYHCDWWVRRLTAILLSMSRIAIDAVVSNPWHSLMKAIFNLLNSAYIVWIFYDRIPWNTSDTHWMPPIHGTLIRYVNSRVAHGPGMPGTFSPPITSKITAN